MQNDKNCYCPDTYKPDSLLDVETCVFFSYQLSSLRWYSKFVTLSVHFYADGFLLFFLSRWRAFKSCRIMFYRHYLEYVGLVDYKCQVQCQATLIHLQWPCLQAACLLSVEPSKLLMTRAKMIVQTGVQDYLTQIFALILYKPRTLHPKSSDWLSSQKTLS